MHLHYTPCAFRNTNFFHSIPTITPSLTNFTSSSYCQLSCIHNLFKNLSSSNSQLYYNTPTLTIAFTIILNSIFYSTNQEQPLLMNQSLHYFLATDLSHPTKVATHIFELLCIPQRHRFRFMLRRVCSLFSFCTLDYRSQKYTTVNER